MPESAPADFWHVCMALSVFLITKYCTACLNPKAMNPKKDAIIGIKINPIAACASDAKP